MKKIAIGLLLLAGCASPKTENNDAKILEAQTKIDSAQGLLNRAYKMKTDDSTAYENYERDGIGSNHNWNHPDSLQSWINKDSLLVRIWTMIKDSLVNDANKSATPKQ